MRTHDQTNRAILISALLAAVGGAAGAQHGPGGTPPVLRIPAAEFTTDGDNPEGLINYGEYVKAIGGNQYVHAGVFLPNTATIDFVQAAVMDTDDTKDVWIYLKRARFGVLEDETIVALQSPGSYPPNGAGLVFPTESNMDYRIDAANYAYWVEVFLPQADPGDQLRLYGLNIGYAVDDVIFADSFESGATDMWSSTEGGARLFSASAVSEVAAWNSAASAPRERPSWLHLDDPEAEAALEAALVGRDGYGSPVVIPGAAFKSQGYLDDDDYYISSEYGFVYCRPAEYEGVVLQAPVILPDGAQISYFMAFFVDTRPEPLVMPDIRLWLSRFHTTDGEIDDLVNDERSSGDTAGIRSVSVSKSAMTPPNPVYTGPYYHWVTAKVGPYDYSEDYWHKLYAVVLLYTMP